MPQPLAIDESRRWLRSGVAFLFAGELPPRFRASSLRIWLTLPLLTLNLRTASDVRLPILTTQGAERVLRMADDLREKREEDAVPIGRRTSSSNSNHEVTSGKCRSPHRRSDSGVKWMPSKAATLENGRGKGPCDS